ncbi:MAG: hypothetical protein HYY23_04180 [Verrucomicrobia bacterium]|nr:hypothetical protein [Verrucomicrobiota bacterium]
MRRTHWLLLLAFAGVLWLATVRLTKISDVNSGPNEILGKTTSPSSGLTNASKTRRVSTGATASISTNSSGTLELAFQEALSRLRTDRKPEKSRVLMQTLMDQVKASGFEAGSTRAILRFLDSGQDEATGLAFTVGAKHALVEAPTLRTAALDWLGQLDPVAAANYSIRIFEAMSSPEEYAVALRNFARGCPTQRDELRSYFDRLRTHQPWASRPTPGFLEAFDVVPYLADPAFLQPLASLLSTSSSTALRHAALVALDRLVIVNPSSVLADLIESNRLEDQPQMRAAFVARSDIRDPGQRQAVERYLESSGLSELELDYFVSLFPNANRFVSHNLLTDSSMPSLAQIAALDVAALTRVRVWQAEPRFRRWHAKLERLATRLQEQVESANRGGYWPSR